MAKHIPVYSRLTSKTGFTLIESMLTIALLGVIVTLITPIYLKTWELTKLTSNPLPLSKTMLALSEMDAWGRGAEAVKFVSYPETGMPEFQDDCVNARGLAFKTPVVHSIKSGGTWTQTKSVKWYSVRFSKEGITKYTWNTDGTGLVKNVYYAAPIKLESAITSDINWRNTGIHTIQQELTLSQGEFNYTLPFNVLRELGQ